LSIGATDGTNQFANWYGTSSGSPTVDVSTNLDRSEVIKIMSPGGASPTLSAKANIVSLNSGGFTIDWTTTTATGAEVYYLALG
jgi:hypothetical protein